jgi:histidinol-phosphate aminotransferase
MHDAPGIYNYLVEKGIIVRNRSKIHLCDNSLRITIGNSEENEILLNALKELI